MNLDARYNITKRFATETIALLCEKSQIVVSARRFPATASDLRMKAKVFPVKFPFAPDHRAHELTALSVAGSQNETGRGDGLPDQTDSQSAGNQGNFSHQSTQKPVLTRQ